MNQLPQIIFPPEAHKHLWGVETLPQFNLNIFSAAINGAAYNYPALKKYLPGFTPIITKKTLAKIKSPPDTILSVKRLILNGWQKNPYKRDISHWFIFIRYLQGEERETVEHKLKILKREFKHIIGKLTDWKDFVFANALKKKAYAHCTHLQIAPADPQTEICKRVQSFRHT